MSTTQNELVITRTFDAPVEFVWKAWSDPEQMQKWWGPKIFSCPVSEIDFRVGGKYLLCMRSQEGEEAWKKGIYSTGVYTEIIPMTKISYTDSFADEKGNPVPSSYYGMEGIPMELYVTVLFEKQDGKTKMTLRHGGLPAGEMQSSANEGWNESFDKLADSLK